MFPKSHLANFYDYYFFHVRHVFSFLFFFSSHFSHSFVLPGIQFNVIKYLSISIPFRYVVNRACSLARSLFLFLFLALCLVCRFLHLFSIFYFQFHSNRIRYHIAMQHIKQKKNREKNIETSVWPSMCLVVCVGGGYRNSPAMWTHK